MTGFAMSLEGWLLMAGWAAVLVVGVLLLVREPRHATHDDAATILRARFARGELSEEEFRQAMAALDADSPTPTGSGPHHPTHHTHQGQEARHD